MTPTLDVFVHIPKTAGTTLATTLHWVYGPWACYQHHPGRPEATDRLLEEASPRLLRRRRLAMGHVHFGVHRHVNRPCRYFTMLRHPVRRYLSRYYHLKMKYSNTHSDISLRAFCLGDAGYSWSRTNELVRYVSGKDPDQCPREALATAKENLTEHFMAFGLLEHFDESLLLLHRRLGWSRLPFYVSSNERSERPTARNLPSEDVDMVRQKHELDLELYRFAQQRFDTSLQKTFANPAKALHTFRKRNDAIQPVAAWLVSLYRTGRSVLRRFA